MFANSARIVFGLIVLSLLAQVAFSHEGEVHKTTTENFFHQVDTTTVIALSIVVILACASVLLNYGNILSESYKKGVFITIAIFAVLSTGYLVGNTIYMAVTSWSVGLIHWHADFEIWICGREIVLPEPTGLTNRVGMADVHHHGDYRIHLEGVFREREDATLGVFFDAINVPFSNEKIMDFNNGDYCPDGGRGIVRMFVNDKLYSGDYRDYVISPYSQVPPGDSIRIVFA
jgi:hypothetical protein